MIQFVLGKWLMISPIYTCFFQESLIELCAVKLLKKKKLENLYPRCSMVLEHLPTFALVQNHPVL